MKNRRRIPSPSTRAVKKRFGRARREICGQTVAQPLQIWIITLWTFPQPIANPDAKKELLMQWSEQFPKDTPPSESQIREFAATPLWDELIQHMQEKYKAPPTFSHSSCSMDKGFWKGWNVKFKKSGKALCTLYPKQGYFVALIAVSAKDRAEADLLISRCSADTQKRYAEREFGKMGKSLPLAVTSKAILRDVENLIALSA